MSMLSNDLHMWLAPFTAGERHTITMTLESRVAVAMIRIWVRTVDYQLDAPCGDRICQSEQELACSNCVRGRPELSKVFSKRTMFVCGWVGRAHFRFSKVFDASGS